VSEPILLSIVVPIYSEEDIIPEFYKRTKAVLSGLEPTYDHEIIFVDDGSRDSSLRLLRDLSGEDSKVKVLCFSRNFGHQFAITAGMDYAQGQAVITIDGDLQDPPEIIPEMVEKWQAGTEVVYGVREKRRGENTFKLLTAKVFYRFINTLSDTDLPLDAGDFRLLDQKVVEALHSIREENRYIRGLVRWTGFSQHGLPYKRDPRYAGKTKFTLKKMLRFAFDGILSFSDKPLKMSAFLGFLITFCSFLIAVWIVINKLRYPKLVISGWASLVLVVLFMGGLQLLSLGILGLYLGRQYREVKRRPLYILAQKFGFPTKSESRTIEGGHLNS